MKPPPGYTAVWSAIGASAVALLAYQVLHHPAGASPSLASPRPRVTVTVTPSQPTVAPGVGRQASGGNSASGTHTAPRNDATGRAARPPSPRTPTPSPGPDKTPAAVVGAAVVAPLRGATPVAVRTAVVAPSAPPFPSPTPELQVSLTIQGLPDSALS